MRRDAARNRERILAAARELIAVHGAEVPMDALAAHAGLAVGTIYRHYPTKADLVAAVVDDSIDQIAVLTESAAAAGGDPTASLSALFGQVAEIHSRNRAVKEASAALGRQLPGPQELVAVADGSAVHRATDAIAGLLARAQATGGIRPDLTITDLAVLLAGVPDAALGNRARELYVEVVIAGVTAAHNA